jgi:ketosteroid isomerase-like protein
MRDVIEAALRRAAALAAADEGALRRLMHPDLQWTSYRGSVLGYEEYIKATSAETSAGGAQRLDDVQVAVAGDPAVLTAWVTDEVSRDGHDHVFTLRLTPNAYQETLPRLQTTVKSQVTTSSKRTRLKYVVLGYNGI